ncbi:MAG: PAS domain S-box protein [Methanospirillum sp.]|uniref:PAS domain S-box protein n=1 Tax=Methanospirillum sp. TaxID=45200 RepID=UPI002372AEAF|nr:response regulator [Methanospirillum sp.]MDD1727470.1 PAS domain S-box protein [Methanospirillum sp.]
MISVLYVDDDFSLLEIGKLFLERMGEFRIELRDSAQNALHLLSTTPFDIIISDYEMPGMDGLELLKTVRDQYGEIPFILFTGRGREEVVIRALNNGADYYVQKGGQPQAQFVELAHKIELAVQRRNADIVLRESERRYRDVVEMQTEFICRHTPDGRTVFVNEAFCRYFGIKREDILGTVIIRNILEVDQERVISHYLNLTRGNPIGEVEFRVMMPDGSIRWQGWRNCAVFSEEGRLIEYQSVGNDITDRKQAEEALKEQQELFEALGQNIPGAIYQLEMNREGIFRFTYVSRWWFTFTGRTVHEMLQYEQSSFDPVLPEDQEGLLASIYQSAKTLKPWRYEFRTNVNNQIHWILGSSSPNATPDGTIIWNGVLIDITDRKNAIQELEETKSQYQAIFHNTGAATIIVEEDTTIACANAEVAQLCGCTITEIEHKRSWTEFVVPEDLKRIKEYHHDRRYDPAEVPRVYEFRFFDRDGAIRYGLNTVSMIPGTNRSVASILDITDRIDAEKTYHSIFDTIQDVFYRTDTNGRSVLFSPSVADVLGYESASELDGTDIATQFYQNPEERKMFLAEIEKNGSVSNYEVRVKKKDGTPITVLSSSHQYYDATGNILGIEGILRDITGIKQAEQDLKKNEELFRELEAQLPDYVLIHEGETIIFVNKEGARYGGQSQQEVVGRSIFSFTAPEYHDLLREKYALICQNIEIEPYDVEIILPTGERRWVVVRSTTLRNREKETTLTVLTDITERKRAEAALVQANRKLSLLTDITRHDTSNQ